jgi:putative PIN family toxin of toxin-antitoxin system
MKTERIVIDTGVLISAALLDGSVPMRARNHAIQHGRLIGTEETLREFAVKLLLPKFDAYVSRTAREALVRSFLPIVEIVPVTQVIRACRDPKDDKFLEAAVNGRADLIITGDKDLLTLSPFAGVEILSATKLLARLETDAK